MGLVWTISLTLASPPVLGWAEYRFIPGKSFCFFIGNPMRATCILWLLRVFFGPLSVMALSYFKILSFTRNHKRRLATFSNRINVIRETDLAPRLRMSVEETKITHTLVIVVACFVFCWALFAITMIPSVYYSQPIPPQGRFWFVVARLCE